MPDLEKCPKCGQMSVDETLGEVALVTEDGPEPAEPFKRCLRCGWWNDPRERSRD